MRFFDFIPEGIEECKVSAWLHDGKIVPYIDEQKRPAIILCPGGGYSRVSAREAEPVAAPYYTAGYQIFILNYSVQDKAKDFLPLCQLAATIAHVRDHADEWFVEKNQIAVCGFSAGGHLAASLGTLFDEPKFLKVFNRTEHIRPDAMILGYPVITADEYAHVSSIEIVSGSEEGSDRYKWFGLDQHVDKDTPATFLWHTAEDRGVPVENSLKLALALSAAKVPFEYHVFPKGGHGMSVCTKEVGTESKYNMRWVEWSITWLNNLFEFQK